MSTPDRRTTVRHGRVASATVLVAVASALAVHAAAGQGAPTGDPVASGWNARSLEKDPPPAQVQNNLVGSALQQRDKAESAWRTAVARYQQTGGPAPDPLAKPEYVVVWAGNSNASDKHYQQAQTDAGTALADPLSATGDKQDRFVPGLDGFVVLDARKHNLDGSSNSGYGHVANFVQLDESLTALLVRAFLEAVVDVPVLALADRASEHVQSQRPPAVHRLLRPVVALVGLA